MAYTVLFLSNKSIVTLPVPHPTSATEAFSIPKKGLDALDKENIYDIISIKFD